MSWLQDNFISRFFVTVISWLEGLTGSWLLAVILFKVVVRLLLLPLDIKQKRSTMKQGALAGKIEILSGKWIQTHDCEHGPKPHEIRHFASIA